MRDYYLICIAVKLFPRPRCKRDYHHVNARDAMPGGIYLTRPAPAEAALNVFAVAIADVSRNTSLFAP